VFFTFPKNFEQENDFVTFRYVHLYYWRKAFQKDRGMLMMKPSVEILVEKYRSNLYDVAFNMCKNAQDAEDVVQDTFIQYLSHKKDFESEQHIRAWLIRVAINKAKNKNNTFFRRNSLPLENYIQTLTFETEEASELFETVMNLPEKYRIAIHLFYYEDYSVNEIANILKVTPSNVKVRLSRGRMSLRNTLKEVWEDDE